MITQFLKGVQYVLLCLYIYPLFLSPVPLVSYLSKIAEGSSERHGSFASKFPFNMNL